MKKETISLRESLIKIVLEKHDKPVISTYEINWYLYELYRDKCFDGIRIGKISANEPDSRIIGDTVDFLLKKRIIYNSVENHIYYISNKDKPTAQQFICAITPYSYIAYINAMEWHGITDRIPVELHVVCSTASFLKKNMMDKINLNFPEIKNNTYLIPPSINSVSNYDGKKIIFHRTIKFKEKKNIFGSGGVRVTNIGETFLDMLKCPEYCGGFNHVVSVFENYAEKYLPVIIKEITKNGNSMDKARAGYILEELCGIRHKGIDLWAKEVQQGGSRRLIMANPYSNIFSERWCISINR
ncbi:MAG: type IV toxin-antitoxin system AbiEi family antitoxin domain-containing protein [Psychroflexus halocasei]